MSVGRPSPAYGILVLDAGMHPVLPGKTGSLYVHHPRLPFKAVHLFRRGVVQPLDGIRSKTRSYRLTYAVIGPLLTPLRLLMPNVVLTTDGLGRAMIAAARRGAPKTVLEPADIHALSLEVPGAICSNRP